MRERIIDQLQAKLGSQFPRSVTFEMTLQILAWVKLSKDGLLPTGIELNDELISRPGAVLEALNELRNRYPQAFMDTRLAKDDPKSLIAALDLALRLSETGVLQGFDAKDVFIDATDVRRNVAPTPPALCDLLTVLAKFSQGQSAYIGWDDGGQLASRAAVLGASVYLETQRISAIPSLVSLLGPKPYEVAYSDPITAPSAVAGGKPRQFDVALGFPPLGIRYEIDAVDKDWFGRFPERTPSSAVLTLRHLMAQSSRRVVAVVQNSLLFSSGVELALRQDLLKKGQIEAVIALPPGLLYQTNLAVAILIIDPQGGHQTIKFINADSDRFRERDGASRTRQRLVNVDALAALLDEDGTTMDSIQVSTTDVLANEGLLQVNRYVIPDTGRALQARMAREKTASLGDLVDALRPVPIRPATPGPVPACEISMADIPDYGYIRTASREVMVDERMLNRYDPLFLRPYDIVLTVKGSIGRVGIVGEDAPPPGPGGWVANQSTLILRAAANDSIVPKALHILLRSELGQALLESIAAQAAIPIIQLPELKRLRVPVPDLAEQVRTAHVLEQEAELQKGIEALRERQSSLAADLWAFKA